MTTIHQHCGSVLSWPLSFNNFCAVFAKPSCAVPLSGIFRTRWKINIHRLMRGININFILPTCPSYSFKCCEDSTGWTSRNSINSNAGDGAIVSPLFQCPRSHILHNPETNWVPSSRTWRWCNTDCSWMASVQIRRVQLSVLVLYLSTTARILVG